MAFPSSPRQGKASGGVETREAEQGDRGPGLKKKELCIGLGTTEPIADETGTPGHLPTWRTTPESPARSDGGRELRDRCIQALQWKKDELQSSARSDSGVWGFSLPSSLVSRPRS